MERIVLGNSELSVSRICLGCMGFGEAAAGQHTWTLDQKATDEIIAYALEQGINFFDTAMAYQGGTSEIYVGKALKKFAKREDVVLATKFLPRSQKDIEANISGQQHIANMLEASLRRLDMDYIDLYILHMWDYHTPIAEILEGLHHAVVSGKVKAIGISNCYAWQLAKANEMVKNNGWTPFTSVQGHYNLIFREEEREMVGLCHEENIAMTPYSALAGGRLAKKQGVTSKRLEEGQFAKSKYDKTAEADGQIIARVQELADKRQVSMTEISLAWLLTKVSSPIVGATKKHHIDGAVKAVHIQLTQEEIDYLEEIYQPHALVGVMKQ